VTIEDVNILGKVGCKHDGSRRIVAGFVQNRC
jgi:hypothetical protein